MSIDLPPKTMDIASKKLPIILIIILLAILAMQYYSNTSSGKFIDPETCEIYIKDSNLNSKKYLDEYDSKCLDFKNLNP